MRVLVSGFEPFLDEKVNPTAQIAEFVNTCPRADRNGWSELEVRGIVLPVEFDRAFQVLEKTRLEFRPDVVLSFGLAAGRHAFEIERLAVNLRGRETGSVRSAESAAQPAPADNAGRVGQGRIDVDAPLSLVTTLPVTNLLAALAEAKIPARESFSAGTYVCNDLFFQMQNRLRFTRVRSGFIHVPRITEGAEWTWPQFASATHAILRAVALS
jgi:pyroglutamyl-peptidase